VLDPSSDCVPVTSFEDGSRNFIVDFVRSMPSPLLSFNTALTSVSLAT